MKYIIVFWDYFFYRAYCFFKRHPFIHSDFAFGASTAVGVTHMWHILTLCILWSAFWDCQINIVYPIVLSLLLWFYYDNYLYTEGKFKMLAQKYKNEKRKKAKGWGIVMYIISSILIFFFFFNLLGDRIHVYIPKWLRFLDTRIVT